MNVDQIRAAREALERELLKLFCEFKTKTGLAVVGCDTGSYSGAAIGQPASTVTYSIKIHLEEV